METAHARIDQSKKGAAISSRTRAIRPEALSIIAQVVLARTMTLPVASVKSTLRSNRAPFGRSLIHVRATKADQNVLLLKTNMGAGHGGKSGRFDSLREDAEEYAFFLSQLGMAK